MTTTASASGFPFRKGKQIYLGSILESDLPLITSWINDPDIHQFLGIIHPATLNEEKQWLENHAKRKPGDVIFAIRLIDTGEIIGVMALHKIDHLHGTATTGSYIGRKDLWGQGYGTEAKMLLLEYAFNTLNLRRIKCEVYDFNPRSKKCQEKCGYVEEGFFKQDKYRNGKYVDVYQMAVFKENFLTKWEVYRKKHLS